MEVNETKRFHVCPPAGKARSGRFCWWVVRDRAVDLAVNGNNITDYFYDGYQDAKARAEKRAAELNAAPTTLLRYGVSHPETDAEFTQLYLAAAA